MWKKPFGLAAIDADEDFFDLGGHSLIAAQLSYEIAQLLAVDIPLTAVFDAPTLSEFAQLVRSALPAGSRAPVEG